MRIFAEPEWRLHKNRRYTAAGIFIRCWCKFEVNAVFRHGVGYIRRLLMDDAGPGHIQGAGGEDIGGAADHRFSLPIRDVMDFEAVFSVAVSRNYFVKPLKYDMEHMKFRILKAKMYGNICI